MYVRSILLFGGYGASSSTRVHVDKCPHLRMQERVLQASASMCNLHGRPRFSSRTHPAGAAACVTARRDLRHVAQHQRAARDPARQEVRWARPLPGRSTGSRRRAPGAPSLCCFARADVEAARLQGACGRHLSLMLPLLACAPSLACACRAFLSLSEFENVSGHVPACYKHRGGPAANDAPVLQLPAACRNA